MKKSIIFFIIISTLSFNFLSCNSLKSDKSTSKNIDLNNKNKEIENEKFINPYTGKEIKENSSLIPFMTVIENSKDSRPQSGLSYADIIYETSAEGGIPRFISLFYSNSPKKIGPIRSVRPYFLTIAKEFNLPFAHCGGSSEALNIISKTFNSMSINEMKKGEYFFRDTSRKAPHNLYTSSEKIKNYIKNNDLIKTPKTFLNYSENSFEDSNLLSNSIKIKFNKLYNTTYNFKNNKYQKYMDGELAYDSLTNKPLEFDNIVVQKTNIKIKDNKNRLDIDLISKGDGYVFSKGKVKKIKWEKLSENNHTKLYDLNGKEIYLTPGNTIWNIVDNSSEITF